MELWIRLQTFYLSYFRREMYRLSIFKQQQVATTTFFYSSNSKLKKNNNNNNSWLSNLDLMLMMIKYRKCKLYRLTASPKIYFCNFESILLNIVSLNNKNLNVRYVFFEV